MTGSLDLGLAVGYWGASMPGNLVELATTAEDLGLRSVWTAEAYGSDAISPLAWIGAHTSRIELGTGLVQISARTPASVAMTAVTMDHLTGGRFVLGLGVSGPQVVEGWYGQPFPQPLARTREYVEVIRRIWLREEPLVFDGQHYPLPYPGGTGLGKPLRITTHPLRTDIPILIGAEGPSNVAQTVQIADGWLPIFVSPERFDRMYGQVLADAHDGFRISCPVTVVVDDDLEAALQVVKWTLAFYIGGMGAQEVNFHRNVVGAMGFADEAARIQRLFVDGRREDAVAAVPDEFADEIALCGPPGRIAERLTRWVASPVTEILLGTRDPRALRVVVEALG